MAETKQEFVTLKTKTHDEKKPWKTKSFEVSHANRVMSVADPRWILDDEKYKWNGTELAKKVK